MRYMARSYGDTELHSLISSAVEAAKASSDAPFLKNLELNYSYSFGDTKTWSVETSTLFPLWQRKNNLLFSQIHLLYTEKRPTINLGVGDRYINTSKTFLVGVNGFFDYDFKGKDSRASLGLEGMTRSFKVAANFYRRLSDWKVSPFQNDKSVLFKERPANGYDVRLRGYLPVYPQLSATARFFQWYGDKVNLFSLDDKEKGTKDPRGYAVGVAYRPNSLMNLALEYAHGIGNDQKTTKITAGLHYQFGVPFKQQLALGSTPLTDVTSHLYDKVERENKIILETQESLGIALDKKDGYTVFVPQRAGSSISPLIITATVTGKEASKATLTFTSGPFLHSHLSLSNQKLTLKVSKKEVPNGAYGTHYPITLTAKAGDDTVSKATYVIFKKIIFKGKMGEQDTLAPDVATNGGEPFSSGSFIAIKGQSGSFYKTYNLNTFGEQPPEANVPQDLTLEVYTRQFHRYITMCMSQKTPEKSYTCTKVKRRTKSSSPSAHWAFKPTNFSLNAAHGEHNLLLYSEKGSDENCKKVAEYSGLHLVGSQKPESPCLIVEDYGTEKIIFPLLPPETPNVWTTVHSFAGNAPLGGVLSVGKLPEGSVRKFDLQLSAGTLSGAHRFDVPYSVPLSIYDERLGYKSLHYCVSTKDHKLSCGIARRTDEVWTIKNLDILDQDPRRAEHNFLIFSEIESDSLCKKAAELKGQYHLPQGVTLKAPCLIVEDWGFDEMPPMGASPSDGDTLSYFMSYDRVGLLRPTPVRGKLFIDGFLGEPGFTGGTAVPSMASGSLPTGINLQYNPPPAPGGRPPYLQGITNFSTFPLKLSITYEPGEHPYDAEPSVCLGHLLHSRTPPSAGGLFYKGTIDRCHYDPISTPSMIFRLDPRIHKHNIMVLSSVNSYGLPGGPMDRKPDLTCKKFLPPKYGGGTAKACIIVLDVGSHAGDIRKKGITFN